MIIAAPIETYTTLRNGEWVRLHRCPECARAQWHATGNPPLDNGFVLASQPIRHHKGCLNQT